MIVLLPALAFAFASLIVVVVALSVSSEPATDIERRLAELKAPLNPVTPPAAQAPRTEVVVGMLKQVGEKLPRSPKEMGKLRMRLLHAGFRRSEALAVFFGLRTALAAAVFVALSTPILVRPNLTYAAVGAMLAFVLSNVVLARMAKRRQHRIQLALADAIDLIVVSVEAGLGLDQALVRVSDEVARSYPDLADELHIVNLELRAGKGRGDALRNLADRTGVEDLRSLAAMLIQSDKFGTSIAHSLRVYSDTLRTKRRQRAEEAAAKTGVKMVFPLVLCIFPAIWVVTIGPAAIRFVRVMLPAIE